MLVFVLLTKKRHIQGRYHIVSTELRVEMLLNLIILSFCRSTMFTHILDMCVQANKGKIIKAHTSLTFAQ